MYMENGCTGGRSKKGSTFGSSDSGYGKQRNCPAWKGGDQLRGYTPDLREDRSYAMHSVQHLKDELWPSDLALRMEKMVACTENISLVDTLEAGATILSQNDTLEVRAEKNSNLRFSGASLQISFARGKLCDTIYKEKGGTGGTDKKSLPHGSNNSGVCGHEEEKNGSKKGGYQNHQHQLQLPGGSIGVRDKKEEIHKEKT